MNSYTRLFGLYRPGDTWIYRLPIWVKYLLLLGGGITGFIFSCWYLSLSNLVVGFVLLIWAAKLSWDSVRLSWGFWMVMIIVALYHYWFASWQIGINYIFALISCIYFSRLVTMTTPVSQLLDCLAIGLKPFKFVGLNPDRIALATCLMWKSIPYILGAAGQMKAAAKARGMEKQIWRFIIPMMINTVAYALATGDALHARGLAERTESKG